MISDHSLYTKIKILLNFAGTAGISVQESGISLQHLQLPTHLEILWRREFSTTSPDRRYTYGKETMTCFGSAARAAGDLRSGILVPPTVTPDKDPDFSRSGMSVSQKSKQVFGFIMDIPENLRRIIANAPQAYLGLFGPTIIYRMGSGMLDGMGAGFPGSIQIGKELSRILTVYVRYQLRLPLSSAHGDISDTDKCKGNDYSCRKNIHRVTGIFWWQRGTVIPSNKREIIHRVH